MSDLILALPDWFPMLLTNVAALFVGLALFLLGFGLGGRRDGLDVRCRRCRHQYAFGQPIPANCSECGAATSGRGALALGVWRPRWRVIVTGIASLLLAPAAVFIATSIPGWKDAATKAGGIDAAIDAAIANPQYMELERLSAFLQPDDVSRSDDAWLRFAERVEREPAARKFAPEYLKHVVQWNRRPAASDEALESFGRAIAKALRADPAVADAFPTRIGVRNDLPSVMLEPIISDPDAMRTFLRGPVLATKFLPGEHVNDLRLMLVRPGIEITRRRFALESIEITYGRRDGTAAAMKNSVGGFERPGFKPKLDTTFWTEVPLDTALRDEDWDGTVRIDARIGIVPASDRFAERDDAREQIPPESLFDYSWEIRVERVDPAKIRIFATSDPGSAEYVRTSLESTEVRIEKDADGVSQAYCTLQLPTVMSVNGLAMSLTKSIEQEARTWEVADDGPVPLDGFESGRAFTLVLRGQPPEKARLLEDTGYLAGRWTAKFDGIRRSPIEVNYSADPAAEPRTQSDSESRRGGQTGAIVPGATVGPKRPIGTR